MHVSGEPLTAIINSLTVLWCFIELLRKRGLSSLRNCMRLSVYGDDNVCAIRANQLPGVAFEQIVEAFKGQGFSLTPGSKDAKATGSDVVDVTFLKRHPRWHEDLGRWVLALSKKSIAKSSTWMVLSNFLTQEEQEGVMLSNNLREAALWGRDFYDYYDGLVGSVDPITRMAVRRLGYDACIERARNAQPHEW
jgi:hypothetical protein